LRLREARETAKQREATAAARCNGAAGRRDGAAWLRRRSPASLYGRYGTRGRQHVTPVACSPPRAAPGLLLVDRTAATARIRQRRARVRDSGGAREANAAWVARVGNPRGGGRLLNSPDGAPRRAGHASMACRSRTRSGGAGSAESGLETTWGRG
jgi:hypothetical protein